MSEDEPRYTAEQLRLAAAGEILNCIGFAMDSDIPDVHEWGRVLAIRLPIILEGAELPHLPTRESLAKMLEAGRIKLREYNAAHPEIPS